MALSNRMKAVAYTRVSTAEQGRSGLGLEAQKDAIKRFAEMQGYDISDWIEEVQSGKAVPNTLAKRPLLAEALKKAREIKGPVLVAKLDRLSRDVHFISGLMVEKVQFICCDLGKDVEPFMLHIYAAFAEKEREMVRQRTRDALAALTARGKKLGSPDPAAGGEARRKQAEAAREKYRTIFADSLHMSLEDARDFLERSRFVTITGKPFTIKAISRMRQLIKVKE